MPRPKKNPETQTTPEFSNSAARKAIMVGASDELIRLEGQMASIRESMKEQRGRVKSLGIKAKVFNAIHNLRKMEDEAKRDADVDAYRECYNALMPGGQMDFMEVNYGAGDKRGTDETAPVGSAAAAGAKAGKAGKPRQSPYPLGTPSSTSWFEAYDAEQAANLDKVGKREQQPA